MFYSKFTIAITENISQKSQSLFIEQSKNILQDQIES